MLFMGQLIGEEWLSVNGTKGVVISGTNQDQAQIRVFPQRILRKYGYPPKKQEKATLTVLELAELLCAEWAV
jgi:hypothetical protein